MFRPLVTTSLHAPSLLPNVSSTVHYIPKYPNRPPFVQCVMYSMLLWVGVSPYRDLRDKKYCQFRAVASTTSPPPPPPLWTLCKYPFTCSLESHIFIIFHWWKCHITVKLTATPLLRTGVHVFRGIHIILMIWACFTYWQKYFYVAIWGSCTAGNIYILT